MSRLFVALVSGLLSFSLLIGAYYMGRADAARLEERLTAVELRQNITAFNLNVLSEKHDKLVRFSWGTAQYAAAIIKFLQGPEPQRRQSAAPKAHQTFPA